MKKLTKSAKPGEQMSKKKNSKKTLVTVKQMLQTLARISEISISMIIRLVVDELGHHWYLCWQGYCNVSPLWINTKYFLEWLYMLIYIVANTFKKAPDVPHSHDNSGLVLLHSVH